MAVEIIEFHNNGVSLVRCTLCGETYTLSGETRKKILARKNCIRCWMQKVGKVKKQKNGLMAECIEYDESGVVKVRFIDSGIEKVVSWDTFRHGAVTEDNGLTGKEYKQRDGSITVFMYHRTSNTGYYRVSNSYGFEEDVTRHRVYYGTACLEYLVKKYNIVAKYTYEVDGIHYWNCRCKNCGATGMWDYNEVLKHCAEV